MGNGMINILEGRVEWNEGYFDITKPSLVWLKLRLCAQLKSNVVVIADFIPFENFETGKKTFQFNYAKMKVISKH